MPDALAIRRWVLFVWAAALPLHRLPWNTPVPRAGAGEWLFPLAAFAAAPWLRKAEARTFALPLLLLIGLAPTVPFALDPRSAATQLGVLLYVATILVIARQATRKGEGLVVLQGFVCGVVLSSGWAWAAPQRDAWLVTGWPRPLGVTESPNMIAIQACTAGGAALAIRSRVIEPRARTAWLAIAVMLFTTAFATVGHVIFAAFVAAAFAAWRMARAAHRRERFLAVVGGLAFACSIGLLVLSARVRLLPLSGVMPFIDLRPTPYVAAHTVALDVFAASPIVGTGLECFAMAWPEHDDGRRFAATLAGGQEHLLGVPLDPHSTWLGYLAEAGVLGGVVLALLVVLAVRVRRSAPSFYLDIVLVFTAALAVFADVLTNRELALVIGVLGAREAHTNASVVGEVRPAAVR